MVSSTEIRTVPGCRLPIRSMGQPDLHDGARVIYKDPSVYDLIYGGATADRKSVV